jgi:hypothetical protein
MNRRELFPILGVAFTPAMAADGPDPKFFSPAEYELLTHICDLLIPNDEDSRGAGEAGVPWYIDRVVFHSNEATQRRWQAGLTAINAEARRRYGQPMVECEEKQRDAMMKLMSRNETKPRTDLERFLTMLKPLAIEAYCLSEIGQKEFLHYQGDRAVHEFPGCTHREHQSG